MFHMSKPRVAAFLATATATAAMGLASSAQADTSTKATITLTGAESVTVQAPETIADFGTVELNGHKQTLQASVEPWTVTDATGSAPGYQVLVSGTLPADFGTGGAMTFTPPAPPSSTDGLTDKPRIDAGAAFTLSGTGTPLTSALADHGAGAWDYAKVTNGLELVVPADAPAGPQDANITFTVSAAPVS
jgi:hypothetical protein